jgi:hypothetical protein
MPERKEGSTGLAKGVVKKGARNASNPGNAGKGRKKGAVNKTTASVKAALCEAFDKRGGVPALLNWAKDEPTEFYKLWAKMLPTEVTGPDGTPVPVRHIFQFGDREVAY